MAGPNQFNNYYPPTYGGQSVPNYYNGYYNGNVNIPNTNTALPSQMNQQYNNQPYYPQSNVVQQPVTNRGISGRVITSLEEITPNEVPMDRSVSFFPTSDYSCIYAKQWDSDGTIKTVKYIPEVSEEKTDVKQPPDLSEIINKRFDQLETMLNANLTTIANANRPSKRKEN